MARRLGRGIEALIPVQDSDTIEEVYLNQLHTNPFQPRKVFAEETIRELSESIKTHGILQPLIVRDTINGYEIVAGERRFRAAKAINLEKVPVIIKKLTDNEMMELALIENIQREDLNPVEEAIAYQKLMEDLNYTQEELSKRVGKSRPHIANHIRLLNLPSTVLDYIADGKLSMGHGRALLGLKAKNKLTELVARTIREQLSVRELEKRIQTLNVSRGTSEKKQNTNIYRKHETVLKRKLKTNVSIKKGKTKGKIEIEFLSDEELERILRLLNNE
ncbi:ParB/RepB/Spo0J family partition protein [Pueribacillus sp. YX66]|uniref:ParB/RepB/Spo0J family partition protein n=1 Tax=Pueribacillus sp. YX66 TaxID=3229242 RepID=UPI00358D33EC